MKTHFEALAEAAIKATEAATKAAEAAARAAETAANLAVVLAVLAADDTQADEAGRPASTPSKALGRALAALGYGAQFCPDFDFGVAHGAVVDSPIDFASTRGRRIAEGGNGHDSGDRRVASLNQPVTPRQLKFIQAIAREKGLSDDELNGEIERVYGKATVAELDRRDASSFIDRLQSRRPVTELAS